MSWRKLGASTCAALQAKKPDKVDVFLTTSAEDSQAAIFVNSLLLSNYDKVWKKPLEAEEED